MCFILTFDSISFYFISDIDECSSNPCRNGGVCIDRPAEFVCDCVNGFVGPTCDSKYRSVPYAWLRGENRLLVKLVYGVI